MDRWPRVGDVVTWTNNMAVVGSAPHDAFLVLDIREPSKLWRNACVEHVFFLRLSDHKKVDQNIHPDNFKHLYLMAEIPEADYGT